MALSTYADLARNRVVRRILALGLVIRIPMWAAAVVVTLHVVTHLGRRYTEAGLVDGVLSLAVALSGPWRGRLLDRMGLRATIGPSLVVLLICWCIAPWVGYWPLVGLVGLAGLFAVPTFSVVRQVLIGAVPETQRTAALSVDSVFVEISFMIGPVLGVLLVTSVPTPVALFTTQLAAVAGGAVLWWDNPSLPSEDEAADDTTDRPLTSGVHVRRWAAVSLRSGPVSFTSLLLVSGFFSPGWPWRWSGWPGGPVGGALRP